MFEGRVNTIIRPDGSEDPTSMNEGHAALSVPLDELNEFGLQQLLDRLDEIAKEMARQRSEYFFATIRDSSKKVGITIDAHGQPLTPDLFLRMIDTLWINFNADGTAQMPTLVIGPSSQDSVKGAIQQLENSPELKKKFNDIMIKKREEWNAREADRILVG